MGDHKRNPRARAAAAGEVVPDEHPLPPWWGHAKIHWRATYDPRAGRGYFRPVLWVPLDDEPVDRGGGLAGLQVELEQGLGFHMAAVLVAREEARKEAPSAPLVVPASEMPPLPPVRRARGR